MITQCAYCNNTINVHKRKGREKYYCNRTCMASDYKVRMDGAGNPNYKKSGIRICETCGDQYYSYNKKSKYCSKSCSGKTSESLLRLRSMSMMPRKQRIRLGRKMIPSFCKICGKSFYSIKTINKTCSKECKKKQQSISATKEHITNHICYECNKPFFSYNKNRIYCSYPCSIKAGTAVKAGQASIMSMKKYGVKKDANHNEIVSFLRENGLIVHDLSACGFGVPDLLVWSNNSWHLVEIKNPKTSYGKRGLNDVQKKWMKDWQGGPVYILYNLIHAKCFIQNEYDKVIQYGGYKEKTA